MAEYVMNKVPKRVLKKRNDWAKSDAKRDAGLTEPEDVKKYKDISYGEYDEWNLLDVYRPANAKGKLPVIISAHGGGYFYGDKELYRFYCMHLAQFGFAVINYNYRLAPEFKYPAPLEDAAKVFKWVKDNSAKYGLDYKNVFMVGDSAGAQLTSHYSAIHTNPEYAKTYPFEICTDVKLRAIGLACGLYDVKKRLDNEGDRQVIKDYVGSLVPVQNGTINPLAGITENYPATYVFTSYCDFLYSECAPMKKFLKSKGIEVESKVYGKKDAKEIGHVFHVDMKLKEGEKANVAQTEFFKKHIV